MAKTTADLAELVAAVRMEVAVLANDHKLLRTEFERADHLDVRERLKAIDTLLEQIAKADALNQITALKEQVAELKKWRAEADVTGEVATLQEQVAELKKWREET